MGLAITAVAQLLNWHRWGGEPSIKVIACRMYTGFERTFAEYFDRFLRGKVAYGTWFQHVKGWWLHRHDPNVLFLTYEELIRDLQGSIRRIAAFCGFQVPAERFSTIVERCRFGFMKKHESRFDPAMEFLWEQGIQLNAFIRNGKVGSGDIQLTGEQRARFDQAYRRHFRSLALGSLWAGGFRNEKFAK